MERIWTAFPIDRQQLVDAILHLGLGRLERAVGGTHRIQFVGSNVIGHSGRENEVAVGETLHERAGAEPVGTVVREVRLTAHEQSGNG